MGAASREAARRGKEHCDGCGRPWDLSRIASITVPDEGEPIALCWECRLEEMAERVLRDE